MTAERVTEIERRLTAAFEPSELMVKDQSHLHAGHAGAREGKGHFDVRIVSEHFDGCSRIKRHRMVFAALGSYVESDIHALSIHAFSPSEEQASSKP